MSDQQTSGVTEKPAFDHGKDNARLKRAATRHSVALLAAFTLWGAADYWASGSGLLLAELTAMLNALFAGTAIAYIVHEWGHFAGARLSGAVSPVMKATSSFFMFTFKHKYNTQGQFIVMSLGGPIANWLLVLVLFAGLPLETWSQCLMLATAVAIAVSVCVFEFPVINRVMYGDDPEQTIQNRLTEVGSFPKTAGILTGAAVWLMAI